MFVARLSQAPVQRRGLSTLGAAKGVSIKVFSQGVLPAVVVLITVVSFQLGASPAASRRRPVELLSQREVALVVRDGKILLGRLPKSQTFREMLATGTEGGRRGAPARAAPCISRILRRIQHSRTKPRQARPRHEGRYRTSCCMTWTLTAILLVGAAECRAIRSVTFGALPRLWY